MSAATASSLERYMLDLVNEERTSRGLNALVLDLSLNASADAHSEWMLDNDVFSHTGVNGSSSTDRMRDAGFDFSGSWRSAENIAAQSERGDEGLFDDVYDLHIALMNSAGHRANILSPELDVIGIGIQTGDFDYSSGTYYSVMVTQNFARTSGVTSPDLGPEDPPEDSGSGSGSGQSGILVGNAGSDNLVGTADNDTITGSGGNDVLYGEGGFDTAVYQGVMSNYGIVVDGDMVEIVDRSGIDGTDTLNSIEELQFSDSTFGLHQFVNVGGLSADDLLAFCELYVAYFNRAPDSSGLLFWGSALADGMSMTDIAAMFFDQPETQALYGSGTSYSEFVSAVYGNILGRAPDVFGFNYWVDVLESGAVERSEFILAMIEGAKAPTGGSADAEYLQHKAEIGAYFAVVNGLNNVGNANTVMQTFDGTIQSVATAKSLIDDFADVAHSEAGSEFTIGVSGVLDDALNWV